MYIDVTARDPCAISYLRRQSAKKQLFAADEGAKSKHNKYDAQAYIAGGIFKAFALETYGGWHQESVQLINALASFVGSNPFATMSAYEFRSYAVEAVSVALMNGNANMVRRCYQHALHAVRI